jgi:tRNA 2-thiouridine synthesizing protein C
VLKPKKILFVLREAPYSGAYAYEALDVIMTAAAFDQEVSVLMLDDGVFLLKSQQNPESMKLKDTTAMLAALPVYGIEKIFVETESLQGRGLSASDLTQAVTRISRQEVSEFIKQFDVIL